MGAGNEAKNQRALGQMEGTHEPNEPSPLSGMEEGSQGTTWDRDPAQRDGGQGEWQQVWVGKWVLKYHQKDREWGGA